MIDMRWMLLIAMVSCAQPRDGSRVAVHGDDCLACHVTDYDATTMPPHRAVSAAGDPLQFPTTCSDCHSTTAWQPAIGGMHPPAPRFPIAGGPHDAIGCLTCHDLGIAASSVAGANTNCVQCHPDSAALRDGHTGVRGPAGQGYVYTPAVANFCLTCHPTGQANKHPDDRFPRRPPHDAACTSCHDRASGAPDAGGMNTTCLNTGCHALAKEDAEHREEEPRYSELRGDGSNRHFCLGCHPSGRQ